ncbi:MAG: DUF4910 domain-containing protein [Anaerolineae bacterium]
MFRSLWKAIAAEISGPAAKQAVADITRYHRIQASPGFRHAAEWVHEQLAQAGLDVRTLTFPADQATSFWGASSFQEWAGHEGTLHLVDPADHAQKLADFREMPLNLVARSLPFDGQAEIVVLDKGTDPEEYAGLDLEGKIVLARGNVHRVHDLAVARRGAVGLIYDGMSEIEAVRAVWTLPDAVQYTSFWWQGETPRGFGFAITPRQGEMLRRLAKEHTLRVKAHVEASMTDGGLEVVEASIPGATDEEIVLVAHLCHPQPSANDNASGAAALLEAARGLQALVDAGTLEPPRRTLRFLWVPEMSGTYAYLATSEDRIPHMVAGLNLDMVGQDQEQCGSSLLLEAPPDAMANFTPALLARLREQFITESKTFGGMGGYPLFRTADVPFGGGSDHYIFSDPSVGVPMPMVIQWPDRFYHTSADTLDRVDPQMLGRISALAACYGYWLAQAGREAAEWLAGELSVRFRRHALKVAQDAVTQADEEDALSAAALHRRLEYRAERHQDALATVKRLAPIDVAPLQAADTEFAMAEWNRVADQLPERPTPAPEAVEGAEMTPLRRFRGPVSVRHSLAQMDAAMRDRWWDLQERIGKVSRTLPVLGQYWADGQRSVAEIAALVEQETGYEATELLTEYFSFMVELDLVDVR